MPNKNRVFGQIKVKANGELFETTGGSTIDLGGPSREGVQGDYQAGAFRETTAEARVECTVLVKAGFGAVRLSRIDDATVTIESDTGQAYIIRNAYVAETISINSGEGTARLVFAGPPAEEL